MELYEAIVKKVAEIDINATINALSSILGAIVGAGITLFAQRGKLIVSISEIKLNYFVDSGSTIPGIQDTPEVEEECITIECRMDIVNTSATTKVMKDIGVLFSSNRKHIFVSTFWSAFNLSTRQDDSLRVVNIQPHEMKSYHIHTGHIQIVSKDEIISCDKIFAQYKNENDKLKSVMVYSGSIGKL